MNVVPVSTQVKLGVFPRDFLIEAEHSDFGSTGLEDTSYVIGDPEFAKIVKVSELGRKYGEFTGELLDHVKEWNGD